MRTLELRVHGASGTSPESMLGVPGVVQVGGDSLGRFFRPVEAPDGHLEGYSWGLFTSGSWRQGLWFLLLPFGLVNLAAHALPAGRPDGARRVALAALRLLGGGLTAVFALGITTVLVDQLAVQGPGHGRRAAVVYALVGVLAVFAVVVLLGRGQVRAAPPGERAPPAVDPPPTVLADPSFYAGDPDVPVLRRLHIASGLLVVSVPAWIELGLGLVPVVSAVVLGGLLLAPGDPRTPGRRGIRAGTGPGRPLLSAASAVVAMAAVVALVVVWVLALADGEPLERLPGLSGVLTALVWVGSGGLLVLLVATAVAARGRPDGAGVPPVFQPLAGGLVAWVLGSVGVTLGAGFTAGLVATARAVTGEGVTPPYRTIAAAWGVAVVGLLVLVVLQLIRGVRSRSRLLARAAAAYRARTERPAGECGVPAPDDLVDERMVGQAATGLWLASLRSAAPGALVGLAVLGLVTAGGLVTGVAGLGLRLPGLLDRTLVAVGTVALVLFALGLLIAGRGAVLHPAVRRGVNVLWDVVAFWPREVHPVVPPPYAQRAVGDVAARVIWLLTRGGVDRVTLVGYSQGSLICLAALLHIPPELRPRVGLLTHAAQLQLAYPRAFPRAVPVHLLRWALRELPDRWRSLFRDTDPFGGAVLTWDRSPDGGPLTSTRLTPRGERRGADEVGALGVRRCGPEWRLLDPAVVDPQLRPWPGRQGHSDYTRDPAYPAALASVWPAADRPEGESCVR